MRAPLLGLVKSIYYSSPKCFFYFLDHILLYSFSGLNDKELSFVLRGSKKIYKNRGGKTVFPQICSENEEP